jgi:hypothetical protein
MIRFISEDNKVAGAYVVYLYGRREMDSVGYVRCHEKKARPASRRDWFIRPRQHVFPDAEACVDYSAHHALVNAEEMEIV